MGLPSKKAIADHFGGYFRKEGIDPQDGARQIRVFMEAMERPDPNKSFGDRMDAVLDFVDTLLKGHGVQAITGQYHVDGYYRNIVALNVNFGDAYVPTLLFETDKRRWVLTTWGDWVERNERRYKIE